MPIYLHPKVTNQQAQTLLERIGAHLEYEGRRAEVVRNHQQEPPESEWHNLLISVGCIPVTGFNQPEPPSAA